MYILFEVRYPDRAVPRAQVEAAWQDAGLAGSPRIAGSAATADEVRTMVRAALEVGGASRVEKNGDMEVPRSSLALLEKLERFHHALYPEMLTDRSRHGFHYESVEWLGEF